MSKSDLRANSDERISKLKKNSAIKKNIIFLAISAITVASVMYYLREERKNKIFYESKPGALKELLRESTAIKQEIKPKQTVFNDQNYKPRGLVNSITPSSNSHYEQGPAKSSAQIKEVSRRFQEVGTVRTRPWSWISGKTHRGGTFMYIETQKGIDTMSICSNYTRGSFEYRDCRRAAKKYFKNSCSSQYVAACAAGDMIP